MEVCLLETDVLAKTHVLFTANWQMISEKNILHLLTASCVNCFVNKLM